MTSALIAFALGVFGLMCFMSLIRPHWALVLIFSFFGYEQLLSSFLPIFAQKSWLINVLATGFAGLAVVSGMVAGRKPLRGSLNANMVLMFLLYIFASTSVLYSFMPSAGMYFLRAGAPSIVLMCVILPLLMYSEDQIQKMCVPLMLVGSALVLMIFVSPRTEIYGTRLFIDMSYTRGLGERGNPLAIAEVGGFMMITAVLMEPKSKNPLISVLRAGSILLGLLISFLVGSRGQLLFSIFFAVMFYPLAHEIRNLKQFFARAVSIGFLGLVILIVSKIVLGSSDASERFSADNLSDGIAGRMYYITSIFEEYASRPTRYLQGLGSGSFNAFVSHDGDGYIYPHNLIFEILTHHGLIGITLLAGIFMLTGKQTISLIRSGYSGAVNRSSIAIVLALAAYVTMISMKQGSFLLYPLPFYMYLIISKIYRRHILDAAEFFDHESDVYDDNSEHQEDDSNF